MGSKSSCSKLSSKALVQLLCCWLLFQYYDDVDDIDYLETRQGSPDDLEDELDQIYDDDDDEAFKDEVELLYFMSIRGNQLVT